jgi:hypothetical protein
MRYILAQIVSAIKKVHQKKTELKIQIEIEFNDARTKSTEQQAYMCAIKR